MIKSEVDRRLVSVIKIEGVEVTKEPTEAVTTVRVSVMLESLL